MGDRRRRRADDGAGRPERRRGRARASRAAHGARPGDRGEPRPGFDCFGLALDLCNEFTVDTDAEPGITWEGEGAGELPTDGSDMVSRRCGGRAADREAHGAGASMPALRCTGRNRIRSTGLGSRGRGAGVTLAYGCSLDDPASFATTALWLAAEIEGHPDNAAAAALGGLTIVAADDVERLDPHRRPAVLFVPGHPPLDGGRAPGDPRDGDPRGRGVQRRARRAHVVARLLHDPDRLRLAMRDRLHEDARLGLVPQAREVYPRSRRRVSPSASPGAGPRCSRSSATGGTARSRGRLAGPACPRARARASRSSRRDTHATPARMSAVTEPGSDVDAGGTAVAEPAAAQEQPAQPVLVTDLASKTLAIKEGPTFLYTDLEGNIDRGAATGLGLYSRDTRFLSHFRLRVNDRELVLLSSSSERGYLGYVDLTNPDLFDGDRLSAPQQTINVRRVRTIEASCSSGSGSRTTTRSTSTSRSSCGSRDFADIFEVRGMTPSAPRSSAPTVSEA